MEWYHESSTQKIFSSADTVDFCFTAILFFFFHLSRYHQPTMFIAMQEHATFKQHNLRHLRTGVMAGSPCPIEVMRKCVSEMHLTEMTICMFDALNCHQIVSTCSVILSVSDPCMLIPVCRVSVSCVHPRQATA
jgi:hypothetical protein